MNIKRAVFGCVTAALITLNSCGPSNPQDLVPPCVEFSSFTITQDAGDVHFQYVSQIDAIAIEIVYGLAADSAAPENAAYQLDIEDPHAHTVAVEDLELPVNTEGAFYIRGVCQSGLGEWFGPVYFTAKQYCKTPYDLVADGMFGAFGWKGYPDAQSYQVEWGPKGFAQGSGTMQTTTSKGIQDMVLYKDSTYEFYVRSNCAGTLGYSTWAGPAEMTAEDFFNVCPEPYNIKVTVEDKLGTLWANPTWDTHGFTIFELVLVPPGSPPSITTPMKVSIGSYPSVRMYNSSYDFYVRTQCNSVNPNKYSAWAGPVKVNY